MQCRFYRCRTCNYVLDVFRGVTEDEAGSNPDAVLPPDSARQSIVDIPIMWTCPMCLAARDEFEEYLEGAIEADASGELEVDAPPVPGETAKQRHVRAKAGRRPSSPGLEEYRP